ncbi:hypothetical protein ACTXT7_001663 [Hymenolepis weldensis]
MNRQGSRKKKQTFTLDRFLGAEIHESVYRAHCPISTQCVVHDPKFIFHESSLRLEQILVYVVQCY